MFITVVGGGNSTLIFAVLCKRAGHKVAVFTRQPQKWSKTVSFVNEDKDYLGGVELVEETMDLITSDPAECIPQSDIIFFAGVPVHHYRQILRDQINPHFKHNNGVLVGSICTYGGFHWVASQELGEGNYVMFGTQLIPWTCGTIEYGKQGVVFGAKRMLRIALSEGEDVKQILPLMKSILQTNVMIRTDFIACILWPNNPSLHPPILYGLFADWDGEKVFESDKMPKRLYADMVPESAVACNKLDDELVALVAALSKKHPNNPNLKLDYRLRSCILENYEEQVVDSSDLEKTITTNKAFAKHYIPYEKVDDKHIKPIVKHKFYETDLTHGLTTYKDIAMALGLETPFIDTLILWNQRLIGKEYLKDGQLNGKDIDECILPSRYGLTPETLHLNTAPKADSRI